MPGFDRRKGAVSFQNPIELRSRWSLIAVLPHGMGKFAQDSTVSGVGLLSPNGPIVSLTDNRSGLVNVDLHSLR
jgi:hypothetical protein